LKAE
jgi:hypothetical protein